MAALLCKKLGDPTLSPVPSSIGSDNGSPIVLDPKHPIQELKTPSSVLVRVKATSLNYADYLQILETDQEKHLSLSFPCFGYPGIVEAISFRIFNSVINDKFCSLAALGSYARFTAADESDLCGCFHYLVILAGYVMWGCFGPEFFTALSNKGVIHLLKVSVPRSLRSRGSWCPSCCVWNFKFSSYSKSPVDLELCTYPIVDYQDSFWYALGLVRHLLVQDIPPHDFRC